MGRPLTGSLEHKDGMWVAGVPVRKGDRRRLTCSFLTKQSAQTWVTEQVDRLNAGLDAEPAPKEGRLRRQVTTSVIANTVATKSVNTTAVAGAAGTPATPQLDFEDCARRWHHETYVLLHGADAERTRDVLSHLEKHIIPVLAGPVDTDVTKVRPKLIAWVRALAGYPPEPGGPALPPGMRTYGRKTVSGWLWIVTEVYRYAHLASARSCCSITMLCNTVMDRRGERKGISVPGATHAVAIRTENGSVPRTDPYQERRPAGPSGRGRRGEQELDVVAEHRELACHVLGVALGAHEEEGALEGGEDVVGDSVEVVDRQVRP